MNDFNADRAEVTSANVSLKIIQVGNRQMTLSVFRQLPAEALFDSQGRPVGKPWGLVRYCWPDCAAYRGIKGCEDHIHVVWQKENELRRTCVLPQDLCLPRRRVMAGVIATRGGCAQSAEDQMVTKRVSNIRSVIDGLDQLFIAV